MSFQEGGVDSMDQDQSEKKKPKSKGRSKDKKPADFAKVEGLAKEIFEGRGLSYFEWLHEQHEIIIRDFNLENMDKIKKLARGGE